MQTTYYLLQSLFLSDKEYKEIKKLIEQANKLSQEIDKLYEDVHHTTETTVSEY